MTVQYNPMTGARLDLEVHADTPDEAIVRAARWTKKRRAYLRTLIADPETTPFARAIYQRELEAM